VDTRVLEFASPTCSFSYTRIIIVIIIIIIIIIAWLVLEWTLLFPPATSTQKAHSWKTYFS